MIAWKEFAGHLTHLLYPNLCTVCQDALPIKIETLCLHCELNLAYTQFFHQANNQVIRRFDGRFQFYQAAALCYFNKSSALQTLMHQLKYKSNLAVGYYLGRLIGSQISQSKSFELPSVIVPVPLHPKKQRQRGYNQCDSIAEGIANTLKIPIDHQVLQRINNNPSQTNKSRLARWENVKSAFQAKDHSHSHLLLVDDVLTTGATLEAAAIALKKVSDQKISIATIAFAEM